MMRLVEYAYAAASGAFMVFMIYCLANDQSPLAALAGGGFGLCIAMLIVQPTNVSNGMIVQIPALKVFAYVNGRPVEWCGNRYLHDMHVLSALELNEHGTYESVCLGHECHCPESHMERVGKE